MKKPGKSGGTFMSELLYFSSSDLMVQVSYAEAPAIISYASHRQLTEQEQSVVERYVRNRLSTRTDEGKEDSCQLHYVGVKSELSRPLARFQTDKSLADESKIDKAVKNLIDQSLSNYYFEQIGSTLLEIRQHTHSLGDHAVRADFVEKLSKLVEAYNLHSDKRVFLEEIIPDELRENKGRDTAH